ncbi:hypothetical protein SAMN06265379_104271 [Saccharicrinis carchari]|uniref:Lipoprotein n=1 Tax=Saccharicrinis carchari TaxID=1168039 RepID=A0A521D5R0_SACCC|nr:DUF6146 family protein [Saccharicrinis carchari]SMO67007.1 hypothetical protein SAMN06265379_104271 [Saccharicrinis carchari]
MRLSILSLLFMLAVMACHTTKPVTKGDTATAKISEATSDSTQYELIVMDARFDSFLATQPPKSFYSNQYLSNWNQQYVTEWNIRHNNTLRYGDFYETRIDYSPHIDYGIDLNYQLYNYFLFIEKEYGIVLIRRGKTPR